MAGVAAFALFLTLFLPWYQDTVVSTSLIKGQHYQLPNPASFTGWESFSWVEAAVLLVALSVMALLFFRAEGRAFHLPGGDGFVITLAGAWTCFLIIWRMFDKQGVTSHGQLALSSGIEWGIFVALAVAGSLTYSGTRIRAAHRPEPPLPTEDYAVFDGRWREPGGVVAPAPVAAGAPPSSPRPRRTRGPSSRSSWRPAERPEWSGSERPTGWLSAPRRSEPAPVVTEPASQVTEPASAVTEPASAVTETAGPESPPPARAEQSATEQLTIPLEDQE